MEIMPPHAQKHRLVSFNAGMYPMNTAGTPGVHGRGITGKHGAGVNTPAAAVVAAITAGFVGLEHIPNGIMLTIGMKSIMFAAGM